MAVKAKPAAKVVKKAAPAKKAAPPKKVAPKKKAVPAKKAAPAKKTAPVKKAVPVKKKVAVKAKPAAKVVKKVAPAKKVVTLKKAAPAKKAAPVKTISKAPTPIKKTVEIKTKAKEKEVKKMGVMVPEKKEAEKISASYGKELKSILLKRREDLMKEILENRARESDPLKRDVGDIYDEASTERERELSLILGDRDRQKLIEIDDALQRMEGGEYGVCESCGDRIALGRLKAQPFTKLCINCKAEEERQEARRKKFEVEGVYRNINQPGEEEG